MLTSGLKENLRLLMECRELRKRSMESQEETEELKASRDLAKKRSLETAEI